MAQALSFLFNEWMSNDTPLNDNAVRSLDRILDMSLNRCVEGLVQTPDKMAQALSFLFNEWMSNDT
ncbi:hypothetical protein, partial [Escherichia coli]|uniref:hypothetical protein n=1 Tax=Escherichia coli TaxID=562 RepID=UPI001BC87E80